MGRIQHRPYYRTRQGAAYCADCLDIMKCIPASSISLVLTSPPFALRRRKSYGNVSAEQYINWFWPFAMQIYRILRPDGSFVLDIGGSWNKREPTRSLYHFELLLRLCENGGPFKLAQEFYWHNRAKMPAPAQWVTIERVRVKDAVQPIWWLAKTARPKASNRWVLRPYSESMRTLIQKGYNAGARPSGHVVSNKWGRDNGGAIPGNIIEVSNTRSSDPYLRGCREHGLEVHPARFTEAVPEFFIKFLTRPRNLVLDPFAGSNVVGAVAERLGRRWISAEIRKEYVIGSAFRFDGLGEKLVGEYIRSRQR
ncbi:MAG: site-specific DNA-methyltransferase [Candidatus Hydrogenedentota bacterium]|nr:MAG: site-specific DNA-methyltransferase [Candidatus Hydrogenedentota bacterium]